MLLDICRSIRLWDSGYMRQFSLQAHFVSGRREAQAHRVHAVALVCGRGKPLALEHMTQVPTTLGTQDLHPPGFTSVQLQPQTFYPTHATTQAQITVRRRLLPGEWRQGFRRKTRANHSRC